MAAMTYAIGHLLQQQSRGVRHGYRLLSIEPYTTKHGYESKLLTWTGTCAVCGRQFECRSGRRPHHLPRTCEHHRRQFRAPTHRKEAA
jgi:hypothetical protein